jgi:uncharacterized protein (DUF1697 family)
VTVWIAFLRAVNLGRRNKVPMAALRDALTGAGLPGARTLLQSGNVVVRADSDADVGPVIRAVVRDEFGVDQPVMVRSQARLAEIIAANPFPAAAVARPTMLRVIFLAERPSTDKVKILAEHADVRVQDREVYLDYRDRVHGNPLNSATVGRRLTLLGTERNWATVTKVAALAEAVE